MSSSIIRFASALGLGAALFVLPTQAPARAETGPDVAVASRISTVTVYEDRALVTRTGSADLEPGVSRLRFERLPAAAMQDTLTARAPGALILGVDVEAVHLQRDAGPALDAARKAYEAARRELRIADLALEAASSSFVFYSSIRAATGERAGRALAGSDNLDVANIETIAKLIDDGLAAAGPKMVDAETTLAAAKARADAAKRALQELETGQSRTVLDVVVTVEADQASRSEVTLQYMVGQAGWSASYDLRVTSDFERASLGLAANVWQRTGEDWSDTVLEFTTAQPSAGASPPDLTPWRLGRPSPPAAARPMPAKKGMVAPAERVRSDARTLDQEASADRLDRAFQAQVRRSGLVVAFAARTAETVPSGGRPSVVSLARFDLAPEVHWIVRPVVTKKAYVAARVANTTGSPLPTGAARVFLGPDFVGRMQLEDWAQGKSIDLGLGVDRDVTVERERLENTRSTEGIFSKDTVHSRRFRITVENHHARAIAVRIRDQVPVSRDADIEVELTESSHTIADLPERERELNKARGILEWRLPVEASRTLDLRFGFDVSHPKGTTMSGLDR